MQQSLHVKVTFAATTTVPHAVAEGIHNFMESSDTLEYNHTIPSPGDGHNMSPGLYVGNVGDRFIWIIGPPGHSHIVIRDAAGTAKIELYHPHPLEKNTA